MLKATHQQTKAYNHRLVLKTIYDAGQISRAGVARLTRLTRVTVSDVVSGLIASGLVTEVGQGLSTGGKAPILLSINDEAQQIISLDLAADAFRGALVNLRGRVRFAVSLPCQGMQGEQAVSLIYELIDRLIEAADRPLLGIGVGAPGVVDAANGVVLNTIRLDWHDLPLAALLNERYHIPVQVANDSQAAALAEYLFGGCAETANLIVIQVGRGIGCGVVLGGQLYLGDSFSAGEIGHVRVVEGEANGSPRCRCGNHGCLETIASCTALLRKVQETASSRPELYRISQLYRAAKQPETLTLDQLALAFRSGDQLARQIVFEAADYLGRALAHLVSALNIHHVIITGEINAVGPDYLQAVQQAARQRILPAAAQRLAVAFGCLEENVIIQGAAALVLMHEIGLYPTRFPTPDLL